MKVGLTEHPSLQELLERAEDPGIASHLAIHLPEHDRASLRKGDQEFFLGRPADMARETLILQRFRAQPRQSDGAQRPRGEIAAEPVG